jgi:hypothetical protein
MRSVPMRIPRGALPSAVRAALVAAVALAVAYVTFLRPAYMRWGATDVEIARPMPGDLVVGQATYIATRAVTINASTDQVWPLIVQIGRRDSHFVKGFEANRYMLWLTRSTPRLTWCWVLYPVGESRTRLVTRVRFRHSWLSPAILTALLADIGDVFTVRGAMLDVKARAESMAGKRRYGSSVFGASRASTGAGSVVWTASAR